MRVGLEEATNEEATNAVPVQIDKAPTNPILLDVEESYVEGFGGAFRVSEINYWRERIRLEVMNHLVRKFDRFFSSAREVRLKLNEALTKEFGLGFPLDVTFGKRWETCLLVYRTFLEILVHEELPENEILGRLEFLHDDFKSENLRKNGFIRMILAEELLEQSQVNGASTD